MSNEFDIDDLDDDIIVSQTRKKPADAEARDANFGKIGFFQRRFEKNHSTASTPRRNPPQKSVSRPLSEGRRKVEEVKNPEKENEEEDSVDADIEDNDSILAINEKRMYNRKRRHQKTTDFLKVL